MSFNIFKEALDQFLLQGGEEVGLTPAFGEALIDKNIFDKISYCKKKGVKSIFFFTNGILLKENYKKIVDSGITRLVISFGEFDKKAYSKAFGVSQKTYPHVVEGIIKLLEYNDKKGHPVKITLSLRPISRPNKVIKSSLLKKFILPKLDELCLMYTFNSHNGKIKQNALKGVMKIKRPFFKRSFPCHMLYESVTIMPNGDVKFCGCTFDKSLNEFIIGNINQNSLHEIYFGKKLKI